MPENLQIASKRTFFGVVRFLLLLALLGTIGLGAIMMVSIRPANDDPAALNKLIQIQHGMSAGQIADLLSEEEIITNPVLFRFVVRMQRAEKSLQAGYYLLNPTMGPLEIIEHLRYGEVTTERVVIPEGFEIKQIANLLADRGLADRERFIELAHDASLVFGDNVPLDLPIASLEGYLFPDTYRFSIGQSEEDLIAQMVNRFIQVTSGEVAELLEESEFTLHEVVTLASIVEREIMVDWERPIVASVYLNRLAINMPLQADPTVRYVMTEDRSRVLYRDLEIESPYNTYRNRGLPPGPIASPGLASILAVFDPAETDYFFFVSKRDGTHQFSETYNDHLKARRMLGY
ncbi:MAG: endolytic transglycosylase MltG [Firmicutes bacterium]|nr:endolytic transglycosylase MltG [Bacillota bacterium]